MIITSTGSGSRGEDEPPPSKLWATRSEDPRSSSNSEEFVARSLVLSAMGRLLPAHSRAGGPDFRFVAPALAVSFQISSKLCFSPLPPHRPLPLSARTLPLSSGRHFAAGHAG